jgi:hypothetical protein
MGQQILVDHLSLIQSAIEDYEPMWKSIHYQPSKRNEENVQLVKSFKNLNHNKITFKSYLFQNKNLKTNSLSNASEKSILNKENPS